MNELHHRHRLAGYSLLLLALVAGCADLGDEDLAASQPSGLSNVNLALDRPAFASSLENASLPASAAVDGKTGSRWSSQFSDAQWIAVDLGSALTINHVVLVWETAYGKAFDVQVSNDRASWTTVFHTDEGHGGTTDVRFDATRARYVRMNGITRGTQWGYSLYELQVFDDATAPAEPVLSPTTNHLYVATTGSDANAGTASSPFRTIQHAASVVKADSTVHVAPGTYRENITARASGTASGHVRYVSTTKWGAKIVGSGTEATFTNDGSYVDIDGFDISGSGRLGILNNGSHTTVSHNHVHNLQVSGGCTGAGGAGIVNANYSGSDGDILANVVHDIGVPGSCNGVQGIYLSNLRGHIMNNIVYRVSAFGIHLWHAANEVIIANNTVFANGSTRMGGGIVFGTGDAPGGVVLDYTHVIDNIVYANPATSIAEYCYSGQACIGAHNVVADNLVFANGNPIALRVGSATGTIAADPQFVDYRADGTGDYRLRSTSPAIDKGTATDAPTSDIDGVARPRGAGIDLGAYESY